MPLQLPCRLCADVADRLVGTSTLDAAYESIRTAFLQAGSTTVVIAVRNSHDWQCVAGSTNPERDANWLSAVRKLPDGDVVSRIEGAEVATVIWIDDDEPTVVIVDEDWSHAAEVLRTCASVIRLGLRRVRAEQRETAIRRLVRPALRLARERSVADRQALAATLVRSAGRMFNADRVSLALYSAEEHVLKIVAAHGLPDHVAAEARIKPGDWALGHVYSSSRAMTVADVRLLPSRNPNRARYKSQSFAAIPLIHGGETLGVLSITERRDGLSFTDGDRVALRLLGAAAGAALSAAAARADIRRLEHKASIDSITDLFNRGYFDTRLAEEVERSQRERTQLAVLIADIDNFKSINDTFGHQTGDAVLRQVGDIIRSAVRMFDVCARFGGDEFAVLMPNSDAASALACAERVRKIAAQHVYPHDAAFPQLTMSVGVAAGGAHDGAASVVARADRALYQAKAAGKNAVRSDREHDDRLRASRQETSMSAGAGTTRLTYMLVADAANERQDLYSAAAQRYHLGLLLARDAQLAVRLIRQFGPPVALVVDLASPEMQHLALNSIANAERDVQVVAFTSVRELRAFLRAAPNAHKLHILNDNAPIAVVEALLFRILRPLEAVAPPAADAADAGSLFDVTARAREVIDAPGSAAYMMEPDSGQMRGVIRWTGEDSLQRCQYFLPRAIDQVLSGGRRVMLGDVGPPTDGHQRRYHTYGATQALLAAPIKQLDRTIGAVCVFDDAPLAVSEHTLTAFEDLSAAAGDATADVSPLPKALRSRPDGLRTRATDVVGSAPAADSVAEAALDWPPTLLERQRGEFEVAKELARMRREQRRLSVVLFDVSRGLRHRQDQQSTLSREADALQNVVDSFVHAIRQSDLPIRWSGNELVLVLPGVAGVDARAVAERVRAAMEAGGQRNVSVSGGVAELERDEQLGAVVERARVKVDQLLARGQSRVT